MSVNSSRGLDGEVGFISESDGSARFTYGSCEVIATVTGPILMHNTRDKIIVLYRDCDSMSFDAEKESAKFVSDAVANTLVQPTNRRLVVTISIQVIHGGDTALACAINAAALALSDAGIQMRSMPYAIAVFPSLSKIGANKSFGKEVNSACITFALSCTDDGPKGYKTTLEACSSRGRCGLQDLETGLEEAMGLSPQVRSLYKKALSVFIEIK
jgi:hypothetical protein